MHHVGLLLLLLVALLLLGPLMTQGFTAAGSLAAQAGTMLDSVIKLVNLSAVAAVLAVIIAGLLAIAILRLTAGF
ncbi:MAG: hypothetical protein EPO21_12090 [Chloroflexota bacterium]|nr:MAG: hypothetical protein EPO21_12090 [Chloroflexota bacterium]